MKYFFNIITALMLVKGLLAQSTEKAFREESKCGMKKGLSHSDLRMVG
jgi:hypothetical protein